MGEYTFVEWLEEGIGKRGWSIRETARRAGLSHAAISNVLNAQRNPGWEFCAGIARAFEIAPEYVFRKAGLLRVEVGADITIEELSAIVNQLSKEAQEDLVWYAMSLYRRHTRDGG
jgi:transcriptional regulator with XRE-family HTH domain